MAANGWYPDPSGTPGTYRYWDGAHWSAETTQDPRTTAPADPAKPVGPASRTGRSASGRGAAVVVLILVLVVAIVVAVVLLARTGGTGRTGESTGGPDQPSSTASGWDDSSPFPTANPSPTPTPTPSRRPSRAAGPTPTDSAAAPPPSVACPEEGARLAGHPSDGRVHGGRLSFAPAPGYPAAEPDGQFSWMDDVESQTQSTEPGWISIFAVGEVQTADRGFGTPKEAAESSIECAITEGWYEYFTRRTDVKNARVTVDGHPGWIISADIHVDDPNVTATGDQLTFVVVDDGRPDALSVWCGMVPIGDRARIATDVAVLASLRVG